MAEYWVADIRSNPLYGVESPWGESPVSLRNNLRRIHYVELKVGFPQILPLLAWMNPLHGVERTNETAYTVDSWSNPLHGVESR